MKRLLIITLLVAACTTGRAQVTRKEIREAKREYKNACIQLAKDADSCALCTPKEFADLEAGKIELANMLYYHIEGLKAIRHDQRVPFFLRRK